MVDDRSHVSDAEENATSTSGGPIASTAKSELATRVGDNLRRHRARTGLSLEKLATLSGVSRGMIGRIELGRSVPTVAVLSRLAEALGAPLASLMDVGARPATRVLRRSRSVTVRSSDGKFVIRPLSGHQVGVEFFELAIARGHFEEGEARGFGTTAHLVVTQGIIAVTVAGEQAVTLAGGDSLEFPADRAHGYRNVGDDDGVLYLTMLPSSMVS